MSYTSVQITLHWATVLLIVGLGMSGMAYSLELADDEAIAGHQFFGQLLILILIARLYMRFRVPPQRVESDHKTWEKRLAAKVHIALYALLVVYVATGYVSASALRDSELIAPVSLAFARSETGDVLLEIHYAAKWLLLGLLSLHIGGALKHAFLDRDDTLSRMWVSRPPSD